MKPYKPQILFSALFLTFLASGIARAADNLSALRVYPNPVRIYNGDTAASFDNLTSQVKILIFDVNSRLVREIDLENSGSLYSWDLKNDDEKKVGSGIYFYVVSNTSGEKRRGKIAVLR